MDRALSEEEKNRLRALFAQELDGWEPVKTALQQTGGTLFLVGGVVRDLLLNSPLKDVDIEVHGLTLDQLKAVLAQFDTVLEVGKSFGVLKWRGCDWAIPRHDGPGRKPVVACDPKMDIVTALRRRDVTMNAMAIDLQTEQLVDPFDGEKDLAAHVLRATDAKLFVEDPLRFFRVMQFVGRFECEPDDRLNEICKEMSLEQISQERVHAEYGKLLQRSRQPSRGFRWLKKIERLPEILPELAQTVGLEQSEKWHPEGDVFEHTMQVLDSVATMTDLNPEDRKLFLYGALCHDLGKTTTTRIVDDGRITSHGHDLEGVMLAQKQLKRMTGDMRLIKRVSLLVRFHMSPGNYLSTGAKMVAYKRLAARIHPYLNLKLLAQFSSADHAGRNPEGDVPLPIPVDDVAERFIKKAQEYGVLTEPEAPVLTGEDLAGTVAQGPQFGVILRRAYEIQIAEGVTDKEKLLSRSLRES